MAWKRELVTKPSTAKGKKYMAVVYERPPGSKGLKKRKTVHFGQKGAGDYTTHKDAGRKASYLARHGATEDWGKSGIATPGFLAKNVLWNKPSIRESVDDLNKKYKDTTFVAHRTLFMPPPKPLPKPPPKPIVPKTGPTIAASDLPPALARLGPMQLPPMPKRYAGRIDEKTPYRNTRYGPPR